MYTKHELAARFGIKPRTIEKYIEQGVLPPPNPPRGPKAAYGPEHIERLEWIWGEHGLKRRRVRMIDLAERPWHPKHGWDC